MEYFQIYIWSLCSYHNFCYICRSNSNLDGKDGKEDTPSVYHYK